MLVNRKDHLHNASLSKLALIGMSLLVSGPAFADYSELGWLSGGKNKWEACHADAGFLSAGQTFYTDHNGDVTLSIGLDAYGSDR